MPRLRKTSDLEPQVLAIAQRMTAEVARLVRAHVADALARAINGASRNGARAPSGASPRRGRGRADGAALRAKLLGALQAAKKGLSLGEVVKSTGVDGGAAQYHLRALRSAKKVKVVGTRRTARWVAA